MSKYSDAVTKRDGAWERLSNYLDGIWQGKHKFDQDAYRKLRDDYTTARTSVDDLWKQDREKVFER